MTRVLRTKSTGRYTATDGYTHDTVEVELDGLPNLEVDVKVPKNVDNIKNPDKRAEKVGALAIKEAKDTIEGLVADHAG